MKLSGGSSSAIATTLLMLTLGTGSGAGMAGTAVSIGDSHRSVFPALAVVIIAEAVITASFILLAGRLSETQLGRSAQRDPGQLARVLVFVPALFAGIGP